MATADPTDESKPGLWSNPTLLKIIRVCILSICILIVAIPEGMPLAISLAMALSIQSLKKSNILIKNLEAIQTCGMLHDVCISKSGTLTTDRMSVSKVHFKGGKAIDIKDVASQYSKVQHFLSNLLKTKSKMQHPPDLINFMKDAIIGGTTSWLDVNDDPQKEIDGFK